MLAQTQITSQSLSQAGGMANTPIAAGGADKLAQYGMEKFGTSPGGLVSASINPESAARAATMPEPGMLSGYGKELGGMWDKLWTKEGGTAAFNYGIPAIGMGMSLQDTSDPNAQRKQVGHRKVRAFYCILFRHQDGVAILQQRVGVGQLNLP